MKVRNYFLVGQVERGQRYDWRPAYSYLYHFANGDAGLAYPWMTQREAQRQAKHDGVKAIFVDDSHPDAVRGRAIRDNRRGQ